MPLPRAGTQSYRTARASRRQSLLTVTQWVAQRTDVRGVIADVLQLQPDTTTIAAIFGSTSHEQFRAGECRREFAPLPAGWGSPGNDVRRFDQARRDVRA